MDREGERPFAWRLRGAAGAVALTAGVTLLGWAPVVRGPFHFDDYPNLVLDDAMGGGDALRARLTEGVRPLLRLSYVLDERLWGMRAAGFLLTNLALHVATVVGVLLLARRRLGSAVGALVAACVFSVQPANAETVAYVSGRSSGGAAALLVWALLGYELSRDARGGRRQALQALSLLGFVAACLVKETAVVFPALLLLWEWTRMPGERPAPPLAVGFVIACVVVAAATVAVLGVTRTRYRDLASYSLHLRSPLSSLVVNARAVPEMLSLWVRPWALSVDHDFEVRGCSPSGAAGVGALAALVAAGVLLRRRIPHASFAIAWALVCLAPTNSVIAKIDPVTEKPLYLAWVGPSIAIGALAGTVFRDRRARPARAGIVIASAVTLIAVGVLATRARVRVWSDARTLWADAAAEAPQKSRVWNNLGMAYLDHDQDGAALRAFERALALDADNKLARRNVEVLRFLAGPGAER